MSKLLFFGVLLATSAHANPCDSSILTAVDYRPIMKSPIESMNRLVEAMHTQKGELEKQRLQSPGDALLGEISRRMNRLSSRIAALKSANLVTPKNVFKAIARYHENLGIKKVDDSLSAIVADVELLTSFGDGFRPILASERPSIRQYNDTTPAGKTYVVVTKETLPIQIGGAGGRYDPSYSHPSFAREVSYALAAAANYFADLNVLKAQAFPNDVRLEDGVSIKDLVERGQWYKADRQNFYLGFRMFVDAQASRDLAYTLDYLWFLAYRAIARDQFSQNGVRNFVNSVRESNGYNVWYPSVEQIVYLVNNSKEFPPGFIFTAVQVNQALDALVLFAKKYDQSLPLEKRIATYLFSKEKRIR